MPTIARHGPYRIFFYSNEGAEPIHIHVQRESSVAKFWLEPVALASASGFSARELRLLEQIVTDHRQPWIEAWYEFFDRRSSPESS